MKFAVLATCVLLTGCASLDKYFENRPVCTLAGDEAYVTSWWGGIGISAKIAKADVPIMCPGKEQK
jgi:hypothetical protein